MVKDLDVTTKVFDLVSPQKLSEMTGIPLDEVERIKNGGEINQEFIAAVLLCFPEMGTNELFGFKSSDEK